MKIRNLKELITNGLTGEDREARRICLEIIDRVIEELDPRRMLYSKLRRVGSKLHVDGLNLDLDEFRHVYLVGFGKASHLMAEAVERLIGDRLTRGFVNILRDVEFKSLTGRVEFRKVSHPIPDEEGLLGAKEILKLASEASDGDLVICLISGGGSAMAPLPAEGVTLRDKQKTTGALLRCGARIDEVNAVRKHISAFKGGQLARAAYPATVLSLIISDVVGDPLEVIASGPTSPDSSTFRDAYEILRRYGIWETVPGSVRKRIEAGLRGEVEETPKPGDKVFERVHNVIVGNNRLACRLAADYAQRLGLNTLILSSVVEGEARHVGTVYGSILVEEALADSPIEKPAVVIAGGETTVTVRGSGLGGRNQELVLSASRKIKGLRGVAIASIGTDGVDGPTDAAGAVADGMTLVRARERGLNPEEYLDDNDSYRFFENLGDLVFTGPTGTNVTDITVMVALKTG